ncbi:MAG TPA: hypothetical protein VFA66_00060 [Gaiellaceae bacterium]|nr:hypothetical protein [Gaiellaceae bacterium]
MEAGVLVRVDAARVGEDLREPPSKELRPALAGRAQIFSARADRVFRARTGGGLRHDLAGPAVKIEVVAVPVEAAAQLEEAAARNGVGVGPEQQRALALLEAVGEADPVFGQAAVEDQVVVEGEDIEVRDARVREDVVEGREVVERPASVTQHPGDELVHVLQAVAGERSQLLLAAVRG